MGPAAPADGGAAADRAEPGPSRGRERLPEAGYLIFGDSFSRIFSLVRHAEIGIKPYKGGSAKGLTKPGNTNREDIAKTLAQRPGTHTAVFVFGSVDVHMSYYYCKYGREPPEEIDLEAIARAYVAFVAGLPGPAQRLVVGAYPSSLIEAESVPKSVAAYGVLSEAQAARVDLADCSLAARQGRTRAFNAALRAACAEHAAVDFVDICDELLDPATLQLRPAYLDISTCNIHVVWETTILLWLQRR